MSKERQVNARIFEALHGYVLLRAGSAKAEKLLREVLGDEYHSTFDKHAWFTVGQYNRLARGVKALLGDHAISEALATMVPRRRDYSVVSLSAISISPSFVYRHIDRARSFFAQHLRYEILSIERGHARIRHISSLDDQSEEEALLTAEVSRGILAGVPALFDHPPAMVSMTKSGDAPHSWDIEARWKEDSRVDLLGLAVGLVLAVGAWFLLGAPWVFGLPVLGWFIGREVQHYQLRRYMVMVSEEQRRLLGENERDFERRFTELQALNEHLEERVEERTSELHDAMSQLVAQNRDLKGTVEQLKAIHTSLLDTGLNLSIDEFVGDFAHEIRNPLSSVRANLDLVDSISGSPAELQELTELSHDMKVAVQQMNDVLSWFVGTFRGKRDEYQHLNVSEELRSAIRLLRRSHLNAVRLHADLGSVPDVGSHGRQINQVFVNLLLNARQAIEGEGNIWVSTKADNGCVHVAIRDDGCGLDEDVREKIFERGYSTKGKNGRGLGLFICKEIVDRHDGKLFVESAPGRGSTFTVELPVWRGKPELRVAEDETRDKTGA